MSSGNTATDGSAAGSCSSGRQPGEGHRHGITGTGQYL